MVKVTRLQESLARHSDHFCMHALTLTHSQVNCFESESAGEESCSVCDLRESGELIFLLDKIMNTLHIKRTRVR